MNVIKGVADTDAIASIAELSRLNDPYIFLIGIIFFLKGFKFVVIGEKVFVLWVIDTFDDVKSQGNGIKNIQR